MATYDNYKQAASSTGWPWRKLKLAKALGADGYKGNRIQWEVFEKWYAIEINKNKLDLAFSKKDNTRTIEDVRLENAIKDGKLMDLDIRKKEGEYLDPKEVSDFLLKLRLAFESTIKGWATELPAKMVGKSTGELEYILNNEISVLFSTFGEQIKSKVKECSKK